jgi:hypothetical protein
MLGADWRWSVLVIDWPAIQWHQHADTWLGQNVQQLAG